MFNSSLHLEEASFSKAKMRKVNLNGAFLNGATMKNVDLTDAKVRDVDLSPSTIETGAAKSKNVDLEDSILTRADFSNSNVEGVDFDGAIVLGTKWEGARNLKAHNSMTMGISKNSGKACTFAVFKLPARKVKTETPSKTMFKHASAVFKSMVGPGDDESDSGGSSEDDSDDSGEETEDEDEDEEKEKTGLLSEIADGVKYVVDQLDKITKEVQPLYTEESKKLRGTAGALSAEKVLSEVESIKGRARTLDTESAVAQVTESAVDQVLRQGLMDLAATVLHEVCEKAKTLILDTFPDTVAGNDVEAGTGIDTLQNDLCKLVMSKVKDKVEDATKQINTRTGKEVSGLAKALHVHIESLSTKVAPRIAKIIVRTPEQTPTPEQTQKLEQISVKIESVLATFEKILFEDGIGGMVPGIITDQIQEKLGKFAAGMSQKMGLISKYEKAVASRTKYLSAEARQRMEKLSCASKLSSRAIANVMNQSTKYDLPTGYLKQVKMILLAFERSTVELMQDAKEIEYVLDQIKKLQEGGFSKETWKVCVCVCVCVCVYMCI